MRELTDSYCERCGTRYTFSPPPAKGPSLSSARLLARGLKNFVMTDGTSMDEAMAAARIDASQGESSRVTAEFHRTFNFCMTCRQYACDKCWNENQGACLSCAPLWDEEPVAPRDHLLIRTPVSRQDLDAGRGSAVRAAGTSPACRRQPLGREAAYPPSGAGRDHTANATGRAGATRAPANPDFDARPDPATGTGPTGAVRAGTSDPTALAGFATGTNPAPDAAGAAFAGRTPHYA